METLIKLNSSRVGRDKIFRTLQYALRAINSQPYLATSESRDLEKTLASFRKLLRLGTFIDVLLSARQSIHHQEVFTRVTVTLSRIANAMFLLGTHQENCTIQLSARCIRAGYTRYTKRNYDIVRLFLRL